MVFFSFKLSIVINIDVEAIIPVIKPFLKAFCPKNTVKNYHLVSFLRKIFTGLMCLQLTQPFGFYSAFSKNCLPAFFVGSSLMTSNLRSCWIVLLLCAVKFKIKLLKIFLIWFIKYILGCCSLNRVSTHTKSYFKSSIDYLISEKAATSF